MSREVIVAVLRDSIDQFSVSKAITPTVGKPSANVNVSMTDSQLYYIVVYSGLVNKTPFLCLT